jgi:signal transduction histidine kinase
MAVFGGTFGWLLLLRFVQTLNAAELLNIDLEALVQERTSALQAQFERVRELERRQAIADERERLMRDMHDGVGGHLVSMLAMIEAGAGAPERRPSELATAVRDALDDMRLMIDSLEPVDDDLNAVLAMFHDRLAPRLRAAGVTLHWDVELLPQVRGLTPARVLHVLRILQEAVTNAVRHGRCKTLWLTAAHEACVVRLALRDDGCGFDAQVPAEGRGLKNMRRRAELAGGVISVASAPARGTDVELTLAIGGPAEPGG